jgi:hypothetical protein
VRGQLGKGRSKRGSEAGRLTSERISRSLDRGVRLNGWYYRRWDDALFLRGKRAEAT